MKTVTHVHWLVFLCVLPLCSLCLCGSLTHAAKVKVWHHHAAAHYEKARLRAAVVSSEGVLRLSRQLKPLAALDVAHVWDLVEDRAGNLYVATGDEGKLFKVAPDGTANVIHASADSQVLCLALAPDGTVYAGTGPNGHVLRVAPDGTVKTFYDTCEQYVWALTLDADGKHLYAGTGPKGRIHQVSADGKGRVFTATKQEHVLSLATGPEGMLYAGTDKNGLVYRIDANGKGFVLFSAPQGEVRRLLVTAEGVYAGTSAPTVRRRGTGSTPSGNRVSLTSAGASAVPAAVRPAGTATASTPSNDSGPATSSAEPKRSNSAASLPAPAAGENSLYRITAAGGVRELFREKALVLSLLRQDGRLYVGTGMEGQLFEIDEATKERSEIARLDHGQIHCLLRRRDGSIVVGTGDPGKLYVLQDRYVAEGSVLSEVLDAQLVSCWGSLRWTADTPAGTRVRVAVRSGNVAEPDETWSDWSAEQTDPQRGTALVPPARFLQYRVTLATTDAKATPAVRDLTVRYRTTNQAPEVTSLEVPNLDAGNLDNPKKLRFKWSATDANEDELTYRLLVRKDGWADWVQLEDNYEKKEYEWDTTTTPAGVYRLKVVASDRRDNPAEDALTGERTSAPFIVAHAPPMVTVKVRRWENGQAVIEATANDELARLTAASFAVNGKAWVNVFPTDGLFDGKTETFRFKTESLAPGTYVLVLRVRDAAGNIGAGDVVFTVPH